MKRTLPGILLAVGWIALLILGTPLHFHLLVLVIAAIGAHEYLGMVLTPDDGILTRVYLMVAMSLPVLLVRPGDLAMTPQTGVFAGFLMITLCVLNRYGRFPNPFERFSRMVFGIVYVGLLSSYLVLLRHLPDGGSWLVVLSAVTAGSDSGAYWCGSAFGKRKLCPAISPKKTVEGALGGLFSGMALATLFALLLFEQVDWLFVLVSAVLLTGVGILGDLAESVIKRGTGTKDSGRLLAGHGGVLDRVDSLLLAAPVLYYLLLFTGGQ